MNVGLGQLHESNASRLVKKVNVIHSFDGEEDFGPLVLGHQGTPVALVPPDGSVAVETDNEDVPLSGRFLQDVDVPQVQEVEAAVRGNDPKALGLGLSLIHISEPTRPY